MKLIFLTLIVLFSSTLSAQVKIELKNNTGQRIVSLMIGNTFVGTIEKDAIKTIITPKIVCDSGKPILNLSGIVGGRNYKKKNNPICGTFLKTVTKAEYKRDIVLVPIGNGENILVAKEN